MAELNIVTIVNKTDKDFVDYQDGQKYTVPAGGSLPVPDYCAKLWLGDPMIGIEDEIAKQNETDRVAMRTGTRGQGLYIKEWRQAEVLAASPAPLSTTCQGTKTNGTPCKALAVKGTAYCKSHTPKEPKKESGEVEAVSKGAITPS